MITSIDGIKEVVDLDGITVFTGSISEALSFIKSQQTTLSVNNIEEEEQQ